MMARKGKSASRPSPHADPVRARGCDVCRGWGSVITDQGHHELCPQCQTDAGEETPVSSTQPDCLDAWWQFLRQRTIQER
jgi:hypothetical protein